MLLGVTWTKVIFELLAYVCQGLCVWHAWGMGALRRARLIELGFGVVYGVSLETLTILQLHAYSYGHFLVMLGLNIDLSMDAVAIRQDMWRWNLLSLTRATQQKVERTYDDRKLARPC